MKTNIVFVVFDDMGFGDLGCYGSEIITKHIDSLAENGMKYNNFHVTPLCSPSRASLLTGRNHHSVGMSTITNFDLGPEFPNTRGRISEEAGTLAEILREQDYGVYAVGKWHLAPVHHVSPGGPYDHWPLGKGFQRFYGFLEGETDQFYPDLVYDNHFISRPERPDYHLSEDLVEHANQFITDHVSIRPEKPFFMYLSFGAVHSPHQAPLSYIEQYKGKYEQGWDVIREQRFQRQKELKIIPETATLPPFNPDVRHWDKLTAEERKVAARFMEIYAAYLHHADDQIGRLLERLKQIGQYDNTLIVLLSDNGASSTGRSVGSIDYSKIVEGYEDSLEDILSHYDQMFGDRVSCEYPSGWAQACNTPFRYYKQHTHCGGIRSPLIMHWPKGNMRETEIIRQQFHYITDIAPTMLDILQFTPPEYINGVRQLPIHGTSMHYTFDQPEAESRKTTQHFEIMGHRAMIHEGWKAVTFHQPGHSFDDDVWELYDLREDFNEVHDLAAQYPERLQSLINMWWEEARKYNVLPLRSGGWKDLAKENPESPTARNQFVYYGGVSLIGNSVAPPIMNRSYSITIELELPHSNCDGVLLAQGNYDGGYTLYIRNRRLCYEYNHTRVLTKLESNVEMPTGPVTVMFDFKNRENSISGTGTLYINGQVVGELEIPRTYQYKISRKGLSIGRDSLPTVTETYTNQGEFPFSGKLIKVTYRLEGRA